MPDTQFSYVTVFNDGNATIPSAPGDFITQAPTGTTTLPAFPDPGGDNQWLVGEEFRAFGADRTYEGTITVDVGGVPVTGVVLSSTQGGRLSYSLFTDEDVAIPEGSLLSEFTLVEETFVFCFLRGTRLRTELGDRRVETLKVGDLVETADHGLQPIRWIGHMELSEAELKLHPKRRPIRFATGVLGNAAPLIVSPEHRVLVQGWRAELIAGVPEVLVAARDLVNDQTIRPVASEKVEYWHVLFDRHELVWAEGALSESLNPQADVIGAMQQAARDEVLALFPMLEGQPSATARPVLTAAEAAGITR